MQTTISSKEMQRKVLIASKQLVVLAHIDIEYADARRETFDAMMRVLNNSPYEGMIDDFQKFLNENAGKIALYRGQTHHENRHQLANQALADLERQVNKRYQ